MNKEKTEIYLRNAIASLEERMDYIDCCPICEKAVSVIRDEEGEDTVILECINNKCPMVQYTIRVNSYYSG